MECGEGVKWCGGNGECGGEESGFSGIVREAQ